MATGHWVTNRGKASLLLGRGTGYKIGLLVGTQPAAADTQLEVSQFNTVADLLVTAGATECTVSGYARQTMGTVTKTENDDAVTLANNYVKIDWPDVAFGSLSTGQTIIGAFIYDATTDTNDTTRELVSVDWFATGVPTNGGTFTYAIADLYRAS